MIKYLGILFILISHICYCQYDSIEVPTLNDVNTFDDSEYIITLYFRLNENGQLVFKTDNEEYKKINFIQEVLRNHGEMILEKHDQNYIHFFAYRTVEIIAPKDLTMLDFEKILIELQQHSNRRVIYSAKSESFSRINSIWTTGFYHKLNRINYSLVRHFEDPTVNLSPPPPPPPPPTNEYKPSTEEAELNKEIKFRRRLPYYYIDRFEDLYDTLNLIRLKIEESGKYSLNDLSSLEYSEFVNKLSDISIDKYSFIILEYHPNTSYQQYLSTFSTLYNYVNSERINYCKNNGLDLAELNHYQSELLEYRIPLNLIEKYLYYNMDYNEWKH